MLAAFGPGGKNGQTDPTKKWTNGVIPFRYNSTEIEENSFEEQLLLSVVADFNANMSGCLSMVPWTNEPNYVSIFKGYGCWSYIGMLGGEQQLSLGGNYTLGCW